VSRAGGFSAQMPLLVTYLIVSSKDVPMEGISHFGDNQVSFSHA
jgi:hypothetical protein